MGAGYRLTARVSDRDGVRNIRLAPGEGRLVKGGREIVGEFDGKPRQVVLTMEDAKGQHLLAAIRGDPVFEQSSYFTMMRKLMLLSALFAVRMASAQDIVIEDFKNGYERWEASARLFRASRRRAMRCESLRSSAVGTALSRQASGKGMGPMGRLLSPTFPISRDYITYRICGGDYERHNCINLLVDGKIVRSATGRQSDHLATGAWDVREFKGKQGRIEIVDEAARDWGHINVDEIVQTDNPEVYPVATEKLYTESLRPQFHFTAAAVDDEPSQPGHAPGGLDQ